MYLQLDHAFILKHEIDKRSRLFFILFSLFSHSVVDYEALLNWHRIYVYESIIIDYSRLYYLTREEDNMQGLFSLSLSISLSSVFHDFCKKIIFDNQCTCSS